MYTSDESITMIRGDSESIEVSMIDSEGDIVPFAKGDTLYFTIKESKRLNTIKLQKVIKDFVDGVAIIELYPEDTKEWRPFNYVYDVQLNREDGTVTTIVWPSTFKVKGDVTHD